jgi:hypothetical protein
MLRSVPLSPFADTRDAVAICLFLCRPHPVNMKRGGYNTPLSITVENAWAKSYFYA